MAAPSPSPRPQDEFLETHGCKLGFMSAFVKAAATALQEVPAVNAVIDGEWAAPQNGTKNTRAQETAESGDMHVSPELHPAGQRCVLPYPAPAPRNPARPRRH